MTNTDRSAALSALDARQETIRDHTLSLHVIGDQLTQIESWFWAHLADVREAARQQLGGPLPDDVTAIEPEPDDPAQPACTHPEGYDGECPCPPSCVCCQVAARTTPDNPAASSNAVDNCCVCGGSPVVYRNYREQPFCWPCADCSCNQDVCVRTGINDPAVSGDAALRQQIAAAEHRLRLAHEARRAKEHQLDGIRRALCDVGAMRDDDPYSHADLEDVIRQVFMPPLPVASGEWLRTGTLDLSIPDQPQEPQ